MIPAPPITRDLPASPDAPEAVAAPRPSSRRRFPALRRFLRNPTSVIALAVFVIVLLFAFVGPLLWPYSYDVYTDDISQAPSLAHPFGTDSTGYDTMSQIMRGTQRSVLIALVVAISATIVGSIVGAIAGYFRGFTDGAIMRVIDIILVFPSIAVAAVLAYLSTGTETSWVTIAAVLAFLAWPVVARIVRATVMSLAASEYVLAARGLGVSHLGIIVRHLIPNAMGTITVAVSVLTATAILSETALSYLGFGVQAPDTSLGLLVATSQSAVMTRPWLFYFPGLFIVVVALSASFIGDGIRHALDPRQSMRRSA